MSRTANKGNGGPLAADTCDPQRNSRDSMGVMLKTIRELKNQIVTLERKLSKAQHFAHHDPLTGLANRSLLKDRLHQAINHADRHQNLVAILLLDLDDFKRVNDDYGHHIGDALLVLAANRVNEAVRSVDSVYRYGGDEFVVLIPDVKDRSGPFELKAKLQASMARPYMIGEHPFIAAASIGVAIYPIDGDDQHELIKHADNQMYAAKQTTQQNKTKPLRSVL